MSSLKPIYVSVGHRISLDSAVMIVKMTCKYRVPEPIRQVRCILICRQTDSYLLDYCKTSKVRVVKYTVYYMQADMRSRAYLQKHQLTLIKEPVLQPTDQVTCDVSSAVLNPLINMY